MLWISLGTKLWDFSYGAHKRDMDAINFATISVPRSMDCEYFMGLVAAFMGLVAAFMDMVIGPIQMLCRTIIWAPDYGFAGMGPHTHLWTLVYGFGGCIYGHRYGAHTDVMVNRMRFHGAWNVVLSYPKQDVSFLKNLGHV